MIRIILTAMLACALMLLSAACGQDASPAGDTVSEPVETPQIAVPETATPTPSPTPVADVLPVEVTAYERYEQVMRITNAAFENEEDVQIDMDFDMDFEMEMIMIMSGKDVELKYTMVMKYTINAYCDGVEIDLSKIAA